MGWRDTLMQGSFRGEPFLCESVISTIGRRTVVHEYPGSDDAKAEDLGRLPADFQIEAFVIGDGYNVQRDKLTAALEQGGTGVLIHPYWGMRTVALSGKVRVQESTAEGGMARFSIPFIEVGPRLSAGESRAKKGAKRVGFQRMTLDRLPAASTLDTEEVVARAVDAAAERLAADFGASFDTNVIEQAITNAQTAVGAGLQALRDVKADADAALNLVDDGVFAIDRVVDGLSDVIDTPDDLAALVQGVVAQVFASIGSLDDTAADLIDSGDAATLPYSDGPTSQRFRSQVLMAAWRAMNGFDAAGMTVLGTGSQATAESANLAAVLRLFRVGSAIEAARAASQITFDNFDLAFSVLDELAAALDDLAEEAIDDAEYRALANVRAALARHIQTTAVALPRVVQVTPPETVPALVLAQQLYGDARWAEDLIKRNGFRNPVLVEGGVALEALSND